MTTEIKKGKTGVVVPVELLSDEVIKGLIEEFVLREGTDYGTHEYSLSEKQDHVFKQLKSGKVLIVFDPEIETTTIVRREVIKA